jgi:cell division septation protein DedD
MADDGFHEIQLSGKQLVFLFMMATVVLVAAFLCGVQVGRGVRSTQSIDTTTAEALSTATPPPAASTPSQPAASSGPPAAEPPTPAQESSDDELSYAKRLQGESTPAEKLKSSSPAPRPAEAKAASSAPAKSVASAPPAKPAAVVTPPAKQAAPAAATPPPAPASAPKPDAAPTSTGQPGSWVVQLQALKNRGEAAGIADRLAAKGYPAFVQDSLPGEPVYYKVQVGGYADRPQADQVARRLEKDEHFKPYVRHR